MYLLLIFLFVSSQILFGTIFTSYVAWNNKKYISIISSLLLIISGVILIILNVNYIYILLFLFVSFYAIFNALKIFSSRINYTFLYKSAARTFFATSLLLTLIIFIVQTDMFIDDFLRINLLNVVFPIISLILVFILFINTLLNIKRSSVIEPPKRIIDKSTITVAIPARNEDSSLNDCIEAVLADKYPKLEVIVYDDDSHDNTAEIIKQYAQNGVRFIKGGKVPPGWLAKNYAYQKLLNNSSGEYILFMGANVRISDNTINELINYISSNGLEMVSIIPKVYPIGLLNVLVQPIRYWWEISWLKIFKSKTPPSLGTCWIVSRKALINNGGFNSFKNSIIPESHFAKRFNNHRSYRFIQSPRRNSITNHYTFSDQLESSIRNRYPQLHRKPENVMLMTLIYTLIILLPFILLPYLLINLEFNNLLSWVYFMTVFLIIINHFIISKITNVKFSFISFFNFPFVVAADILMIHISMFKYEFGEVSWRGRNISRQTMNVYKKLPDFD